MNTAKSWITVLALATILNLAKENRFSEVFAVDLSLKALEKWRALINIPKSFGLIKIK